MKLRGLACKTTIGSIAEFRADSEKIELYLERVDLYFTANNLPNDRRVPALLSVLGASAYEDSLPSCRRQSPMPSWSSS